jgi:hypothetical protein
MDGDCRTSWDCVYRVSTVTWKWCGRKAERGPAVTFTLNRFEVTQFGNLKCLF